MVLKDLTTNSLREVSRSDEVSAGSPGDSGGWVLGPWWLASDVVDRFEVTWAVPPEPSTRSTQQIYLWSGLEAWVPATATTPGFERGGLLQPVLQWGGSHAGGGPSWSVSSWYFQNSTDPDAPQSFQTPAVPVKVGQTLAGVMTRTTPPQGSGNPPGAFDYQCEFQGIAGTSLHLSNLRLKLNLCYIKLETFGVNACSQYPNTVKTLFENIGITVGGTLQTVKWNLATDRPVLACGEHLDPVVDNARKTAVNLFYRNP
jgi:hypothetical protein